jgi:hypothetical protein
MSFGRIAVALAAAAIAASSFGVQARADDTASGYQGPAFMAVYPETSKCYEARQRNDDVGIVRMCRIFATRIDREIAKPLDVAGADDGSFGTQDGISRSVLGVWSAQYWYAVAQAFGRLRNYKARQDTLTHIAQVLASIDVDGLEAYDRANADDTAGRYRRIAALVRDSLATLTPK